MSAKLFLTMTWAPYRHLAACDEGGAGWKRTAPVLARWADVQREPDTAQSERIAAHLIRQWAPVMLDAYGPHAASAQLRRADPANWHAPTAEVYRLLSLGRGQDRADLDTAHDVLRAAAGAFAREAATRGSLLTAVAVSRVWLGVARDIAPAILADPVPALAAADRAAEEWVLLAEPGALARLPSEIRAALDMPDGYAVAWDWLSSQGDAAEGTDDGLRVSRGVDAAGAPVPEWARRTALIRAILRVIL